MKKKRSTCGLIMDMILYKVCCIYADEDFAKRTAKPTTANKNTRTERSKKMKFLGLATGAVIAYLMGLWVVKNA